jgi:hypothetical protein
MDIHEIPGATAQVLAEAHAADVKTEGEFGVVYHKYWFNESQGKAFCLCSAPNPEAAIAVHRKAHGMVADKIIEVAPEVAEGFLGGCEVNPSGAALLPGSGERDPGIRTVCRSRRRRAQGLRSGGSRACGSRKRTCGRGTLTAHAAGVSSASWAIRVASLLNST